jgi:hypothetical protein
MDEKPDQIEAEINRARGNLNDNLLELEDKVKGAFDWRRQFEERPLVMLGLAVGGGILAAALIPWGRSRRRYDDDGPKRSEPRKFSRRSWTDGQTRGPWEALTGALLTAAATRIGSKLGQLVNNYRDHLHEDDRYRDREERYSSSQDEPVRSRPH